MAAFTRSRSVERQVVEDLLRSAGYGETIEYSRITSELSVPVSSVWHVVHAVRDAMKPDGYVFEAVRGIGLRRLTDEEIAVGVVGHRRRKIHRQGLKAMADAAAVMRPEEMSKNAQMSHLIGQSLFAAIAAVTTQRAVKAIAENVARTGKSLPVDATIEAFRRIG